MSLNLQTACSDLYSSEFEVIMARMTEQRLFTTIPFNYFAEYKPRNFLSLINKNPLPIS